MMNNFKNLEEEALREAPSPPEYIKENIVGQIANLRTWSSIMDLFVSAPFRLITKMIGKEEPFPNKKERNPPHLN